MPGLKAKPYEIQLVPGDKLFVYTDGVPEATNEQEEQYGINRMLDTLNENQDATMEHTLRAISESVNRYKGEADQFDDLTMLGFEFVQRSK